MNSHSICGFNDNTNPELCARWQALGAFYPFSRNHNSNSAKEQDPAFLGPDVVAATKNSLQIRYKGLYSVSIGKGLEELGHVTHMV